MPVRSTSLLGLGLLSAVVCAILPPLAAAGGVHLLSLPRVAGSHAPDQNTAKVVRVAEASTSKCREELEILAGLMKEGDRARLAIETLGRVAQCEAVKAAVRALGPPRSVGRPDADPRRNDSAKSSKDGLGTEPARAPAGVEPRDRKSTGPGDSVAKPEGQIPASIDKDEADRRKAAEEAERRRAAEEADRRKAEDAAKRREAAEARRLREAARKKAEIGKVEVKRNPTTEKAGSSGLITQARCASMVRAKYGYIYAAVDWQMRISMCLSTHGANY